MKWGKGRALWEPNKKLPTKNNEYTWKERFKNLIENFPKAIDKPFKEIIHSQRDIKLRHFPHEEPDEVLKKNCKKKSCKSRRNNFKYMEDKEIW